MSVDRRTFLQRSFAAAAFAFVESGCRSRSSDTRAVTEADPDRAVAPDLELSLRAAPDTVALLDGKATDVWRFSSRIVRGSRDALVDQEAGYLGPTLRVKRGQRVRVHLDNALSEATIVHWHGLDVAARADGHPGDAVGAGGTYLYDFEVDNRAGTYWYHSHPADRTGPQVYRGLAGLLLVTDDVEQSLGLPDGDRELTLVLQDRTFDGDNQLVYAPDPMIGFLGDDVLVNGRPARTHEVRRGPHRLRILNGSNSRIYDLGWSDGSPMIVLGTDGGLFAAPRERSHVVLAPGQRLDLWASFGERPGDDVWLESRAFDGVGGMTGMGMMGRRARSRATTIAHGAPMRIQRFVAVGDAARGGPPERLAAEPGPPAAEVSNPGAPRTFTTAMRMMRWSLNGRTFEMRGVAPNERVRLGAVEEWEFVNPAGPMAMAHPIHIHGSQFQIIERRSGSGALALHDGILDEGWQDTFLLLPGDSVRVRITFKRHAGMFLYHCHNLEHEDLGMMRNYLVES